MRPTLAFQLVGRVHVIVHGSETPSESDWTAYLDHVSRHAHELKSMFVYSHGGGPNGSQRDALQKTYARMGRRPQAAIVTPSPFVRMIANTVSSLAGNPVQVFSPPDVDKAFVFLALEATERARIRTAVAALSASVNQK